MLPERWAQEHEEEKVDEVRQSSASPQDFARELGGGRELRTFVGHAGPVLAVAVTPDGQRAVSASADQTLRVWELASGRELRTLTGHKDRVMAVAVTADGQRAVSASFDKTLKVWNLESGREVRTLTGHSGFVYAVAVTPDGQRAVSASSDQTLKVWELGSGRELRTLTGHSDWVRAVAPPERGQLKGIKMKETNYAADFVDLFMKGVERAAELQKKALEAAAQQTAEAIAASKKAIQPSVPDVFDVVQQGFERYVEAQKGVIDLVVQQTAAIEEVEAPVLEYAEVLAHAVETFGSRTNANAWLNRPNRVFHNQSPLQILTQDPDAVEEELVRIDHGMFI